MEGEFSYGWVRDLPDFRDYTSETPEIKGLLEKSRSLKSALGTRT